MINKRNNNYMINIHMIFTSFEDSGCLSYSATNSCRCKTKERATVMNFSSNEASAVKYSYDSYVICIYSIFKFIKTKAYFCHKLHRRSNYSMSLYQMSSVMPSLLKSFFYTHQYFSSLLQSDLQPP